MTETANRNETPHGEPGRVQDEQRENQSWSSLMSLSSSVYRLTGGEDLDRAFAPGNRNRRG